MDYSALANGGITRIKPYQAGKPVEEVQRELGIKEVIKLASNENPVGMSPAARKAALQALELVNFYPDSNGFYLKQKLQAKFGYDPKQITLGAGSNELINLLFQAFANSGVNVVLPEYSFVVYSMEATVNAAKIITVPLKDWNVDLDAVYQSIDKNTRIVAFANPSNPVGTAISASDMHEFVKKVPESTLVVIDEAYNEFNAGDKSYVDSASWMAECPNLIVSRTFSKAYGLAGLRVGYMLANEEITSLLNRIRAPFNVNSIALAASCAALDDQEFLAKVVANNTAERKRYENFCKEFGLKMIPSRANFAAIDFRPWDAQKVADMLLHMGVIVRPLLGYKLRDILRITFGTPAQNDKLFYCLREIFKKPEARL